MATPRDDGTFHGFGRISLAIGLAGAFSAIAICVVSLNARMRVSPVAKPTDAATAGRVTNALDKLPLSFEANQGQTDERVRFLSRGRGYVLFLTGNEAVLSLADQGNQPHKGPRALGPAALNKVVLKTRWNVLRVKLEGANPSPAVSGIAQLPGKVNYFIGKDSARWKTQVPTYAEVRYEKVYPGIDLIYHGSSQHELEYDIAVEAGADAGAIKLAFAGADNIRLDMHGDLIIRLGDDEVVEHAPVIYQEFDGRRRQISGGYVIQSRNHVGFKLAAYDKHKPLLIDPKLVYSTYLGGNNLDYAQGIAVDWQGDAYVTGVTFSTNFPTTPGAYQTSFGGVQDAFVAKFPLGDDAIEGNE